MTNELLRGVDIERVKGFDAGVAWKETREVHGTWNGFAEA